MDSPCFVNCPILKTQNTTAMNACTVPRVVDEELDGCKYCICTVCCNVYTVDTDPGVAALPGGHQANYRK